MALGEQFVLMIGGSQTQEWLVEKWVVVVAARMLLLGVGAGLYGWIT